MTLLVLAFAVTGAVLAIWLRKTQADQTRKLWGRERVWAIQAGNSVRMKFVGEQIPTAADVEQLKQAIEIAFIPNLGHLRHALADDRSYQWAPPIASAPAAAQSAAKPVVEPLEYVLLRFQDREEPPMDLVIELRDGTIRPFDNDQAVARLTDRTRGAVREYLRQIRNVRERPR
jgi:hypothetical protein